MKADLLHEDWPHPEVPSGYRYQQRAKNGDEEPRDIDKQKDR
jgi:hypothetical protein